MLVANHECQFWWKRRCHGATRGFYSFCIFETREPLDMTLPWKSAQFYFLTCEYIDRYFRESLWRDKLKAPSMTRQLRGSRKSASLWGFIKLGIRDLKAKSGRDSGLKVCAGGWMPKITLGITGLHEILGQDYGSEECYWGPSSLFRRTRTHFSVAKETCLPSKRSFGSCPCDDPILRLRREATMRRNRNSRYFVYLKTLGTEKLVWLQVKTLYLTLDTLSRFLLWICDTFSFSFWDQEIQLHVTLSPAGDAISSACVARLPSR